MWAWDARANLAQCVQETLTHGVWGGGWQIGIAAWLYGVSIYVFMNGQEPIMFGQGQQVWGLSYSVNPDGFGGHYDALVSQAPASVNIETQVERHNLQQAHAIGSQVAPEHTSEKVQPVENRQTLGRHEKCTAKSLGQKEPGYPLALSALLFAS